MPTSILYILHTVLNKITIFKVIHKQYKHKEQYSIKENKYPSLNTDI